MLNAIIFSKVISPYLELITSYFGKLTTGNHDPWGFNNNNNNNDIIGLKTMK
jgi:hypothetical protein